MEESLSSPRRGSSEFGRVLLLVAKAPRWRFLLLTFIFFAIACGIWRANNHHLDISSYKEATTTHWDSWKHRIASHTQESPAPQASVLTPTTVTLDLESGNNTIVPSQLKTANPQFHLLIFAPKITTNVCRALLSSFISNYPPPTLVGYQSSAENAIPDTSEYLRLQHRIKGEDFVLFADGERTLFQLPSEVLLDEFNTMTREANRNLASQYYALPAQKPTREDLKSQYYPPPPSKPHQRFNQSVIFAAEPSPPSPAPSLGYLSRFNLPDYLASPAPSLNTGLVLGTASSLRNLFTAAASQNAHIARSDTTTFRTILAQQTAIRASISHAHRHVLHWLSHNLGYTAPSIRRAQVSETKTSAYDLGIGLDTTSSLFRTIVSEQDFPSHNDNNNAAALFGTVAAASAAASGTTSHLTLPSSLNTVRQPFELHASTHHANSSLSAAENAPPESILPTQQSWADVPLLHDKKQGHIPAVLTFPLSNPSLTTSDPNPTSNTDSAPETRKSALEHLWPSLWFAPHARTLLQSYLRRSSSKETASQAAVGGERWWDSRGGRGGVWTTGGEWIDAGELCGEFGAGIFADGLRGWEQEYYDVVDAVEAAEGGIGGQEEDEGVEVVGVLEQEHDGEEDQRAQEQEQDMRNGEGNGKGQSEHQDEDTKGDEAGRQNEQDRKTQDGRKKEAIEQVANAISDQVRKKLDALTPKPGEDTAVRMPPSRLRYPKEPAAAAVSDDGAS